MARRRAKEPEALAAIADLTVPVAAVAKVLGVTSRRVQQLAKEGRFPKAARGLYPLLACIRAYIAFQQEQIESSDRNDEYDLERTRRERANAELAELTVRVRKEELVDRADAELALIELASTITTRLRALPTTTAPLIHAVKTTRQAEALLRRQIDSALEDLAATGTALSNGGTNGGARAARSSSRDDATAAANRSPRVGRQQTGSQSRSKR